MACVLADYYRVGDGVTWSDVYSFTTVYAKGGQPHLWHARDLVTVRMRCFLPPVATWGAIAWVYPRRVGDLRGLGEVDATAATA